MLAVQLTVATEGGASVRTDIDHGKAIEDPLRPFGVRGHGFYHQPSVARRRKEGRTSSSAWGATCASATAPPGQSIDALVEGRMASPTLDDLRRADRSDEHRRPLLQQGLRTTKSETSPQAPPHGAFVGRLIMVEPQL